MSMMDVDGPICCKGNIPEELTGEVFIVKKTSYSTFKLLKIKIAEVIVSSSQNSDYTSRWAVYFKKEEQIPKYHNLKQFFKIDSKITYEWIKQDYEMYSSDFYSFFSPSGVLNLDLIGKTEKEALSKYLDNL
jgi:hypothetical protein